METVGIDPTDFKLNPTKIPPGGVVQNCRGVTYLLWERDRREQRREDGCCELSSRSVANNGVADAGAHTRMPPLSSPWLTPSTPASVVPSPSQHRPIENGAVMSSIRQSLPFSRAPVPCWQDILNISVQFQEYATIMLSIETVNGFMNNGVQDIFNSHTQSHNPPKIRFFVQTSNLMCDQVLF